MPSASDHKSSVRQTVYFSKLVITHFPDFYMQHYYFFFNAFQMQSSELQLRVKQTIQNHVLVELVDLFALTHFR